MISKSEIFLCLQIDSQVEVGWSSFTKSWACLQKAGCQQKESPFEDEEEGWVEFHFSLQR